MVLEGHCLEVFSFKGKPLQEFVELVKKGNKLEAVRHAKKFLATDENQQLGKLWLHIQRIVYRYLAKNFPSFKCQPVWGIRDILCGSLGSADPYL